MVQRCADNIPFNRGGEADDLKGAVALLGSPAGEDLRPDPGPPPGETPEWRALDAYLHISCNHCGPEPLENVAPDQTAQYGTMLSGLNAETQRE